MKTENSRLKVEVISFNDYFKYRSIWMSLAIVWVTMFHLPLHLHPVLNPIKVFGYGGVDIFLFASGIGCYFSLSKSQGIKDFLCGRIKKIMPMQIIFLCFYFFTVPINFKIVIGNLFGLGFFAGLKNQFNWYIGAMWVCYLLAPIFKSIVSKAKLTNIIFVLLCLVVISTVYFHQFELIFWSRLPVFLMGIAIAEISNRKSSITLFNTIILTLCLFLGFALLFLFYLKFNSLLWTYGLWWYPFILITPGLTLLISIFSNRLSKTKCRFIVAIVDKLGRNTFPIYLSHIFIIDISSDLRDNLIFINDSMYNLLIILATILFALLLHYITAFAKYIVGKIWPKTNFTK